MTLMLLSDMTYFFLEKENCPADSVALGRAAWTLLHTTAAYYPDRPAPSQMDSMRLFMSTFADNYPCFKVNEHINKTKQKIVLT